MQKVHRSVLLFISFILLITTIGFFYLNIMKKENEIRLMPDNQSLVSKGKKIYEQNCASCHGIALEGQKNWQTRDEEGYLPAPPHDERGHTWHHPDEYLFLLTKYGIEKTIRKTYLNNMPAYEDILSDKEILAVLSFIKSRWPNRIQEIHDNINHKSRLN